MEIFKAAREANIQDLRSYRPDLPYELVEMLECALTKELTFRFDTAQQMLRALTAVLRKAGQPTDAPVISRSVMTARKALGLPPQSRLPADLISEVSTRPQE